MAELDLLYFGRLRDDLGRDRERVDPPSHVLRVEDLARWLSERGEPYVSAFGSDRLCAAIDREKAGPEGSVFGAREVALFPPMGAL